MTCQNCKYSSTCIMYDPKIMKNPFITETIDFFEKAVDYFDKGNITTIVVDEITAEYLKLAIKALTESEDK